MGSSGWKPEQLCNQWAQLKTGENICGCSETNLQIPTLVI